jgi:hypothetical protein
MTIAVTATMITIAARLVATNITRGRVREVLAHTVACA